MSAVDVAGPLAFHRSPWQVFVRRVEPYLYCAPALILIAAIMLVPLIIGLSYAFRDLTLLDPLSGDYIGFDLRPAMDRLGISPYVDAVVMSFEHGICKPAVKPFLTACDDLQVDPERTLMVGDNPLTDSGAVAAGMHVLLLPRPARTGPRGLRHVLALI